MLNENANENIFLLPSRLLKMPMWRQLWSLVKPLRPLNHLTSAPRAPPSASRASSPSCCATAWPLHLKRVTPCTAKWPAPSSSALNWRHAYPAGTCSWMCTMPTIRGGRPSKVNRRHASLLRCWGLTLLPTYALEVTGDCLNAQWSRWTRLFCDSTPCRHVTDSNKHHQLSWLQFSDITLKECLTRGSTKLSHVKIDHFNHTELNYCGKWWLNIVITNVH